MDLLGFGRSSRPKFTCKTPEETETFFVEPIEFCREYLKIEKMVIAGHSFGGYIAGCYSVKFPNRVDKVVFISPCGIPEQPEGFDFFADVAKKPFLARSLWKFAIFLIKKGATPASVLRKSGPFSGKLINHYLKKRIKGIPKKEYNALKTYLEQVNLLPGSGEHAFFIATKPGGWANLPLYNRLLSTPAIYLFGDNDILTPIGVEENARLNRAPVICEIVSNSTHHLYMDNYIELGEKIINGIQRLDNMPWKVAQSDLSTNTEIEAYDSQMSISEAQAS